jgi:3D (Asp-Asp-Asp) domain-containing protein
MAAIIGNGRESMNWLITTLGFVLLGAQGMDARDEPLLARVTVYWRGEGSGVLASSNGEPLRAGHCAVDPRKIPYGSTVVFPDAACLAVDTGPAVVSRKAARIAGRNSRERSALVIDRFFETKREALAWAQAHPHFMTVRIVDSQRTPVESIVRTSPPPPDRDSPTANSPPFWRGNSGLPSAAPKAPATRGQYAKRRT